MSERWKRYIGLGLQNDFDTPVAATAWLSYYGADTLNMPREYLDLDGTQETRSQIEKAGGDLTCEGEIPDIESVPDVIGLLLESAFGTKVGNVYTLKDGALPILTIEKGVGSTQAYQFIGMKVNELVFSSVARETLKLTARLIGKARIKLDSPTGRSYSSKAPFVFYQGVFRIGGSPILIREFELTLNNMLLHPNHQSGDIYSQEQVEGVRDVSGNVLLDFRNTNIQDDHLALGNAALELLFTNGADSLKIELPKVIYPTHNLEENDQLYMERVEFRGLKSGADKEVKVTLVSS